MCRLDEETTLLHRRQKDYNLFNSCLAVEPQLLTQRFLIARAIFIAFLSFGAGILTCKLSSAHGGTKVIIPSMLSESKSSKYTSFQALNFQLYTGGAPVFNSDNVTANPECDSELRQYGTMGGELHCYMGHSNSTQDVHDRLQVMYDAVELAYSKANPSPDTLKVFVAPEFFFRGRNGAYLLDKSYHDSAFFNDDHGHCHSEICLILQALETLVAQKKFQDWIFLFGTAVVSESLPAEDTFDYLFYNFAVIYKGFDPDVSSHIGKRFLVPKRYVSNIDFLTPYRPNGTREIVENKNGRDQLVENPHALLHKLYDRRLWHAYKNEISALGYVMIEYGWFLMNDIVMTVEICLDHDLKTALTTYLANAAQGHPTLIPSSTEDEGVQYVPIPAKQAQLSLVSSAGLTVSPSSLVLRHGASIVLQDGMNYDEANMTFAYNCYKYDWEFTGGTEVVHRYSDITPTEVLFRYQVEKGYTKLSLYGQDWKNRLRGVFSTAQYEPMVIVFEPKVLAQ